ncbi:MAG: hypothetical protein OXQ29_28145 [Rhodospirillaceae bacterium]|nr:hypothetical protein [Rhodospirillaceae bacterium]
MRLLSFPRPDPWLCCWIAAAASWVALGAASYSSLLAPDPAHRFFVGAMVAVGLTNLGPGIRLPRDPPPAALAFRFHLLSFLCGFGSWAAVAVLQWGRPLDVGGGLLVGLVFGLFTATLAIPLIPLALYYRHLRRIRPGPVRPLYRRLYLGAGAAGWFVLCGVGQIVSLA